MRGFRESLMFSERRLPLLLEPESVSVDLPALVQRWARQLADKLIEHGAILFRGFDFSAVRDFERFIEATALPPLEYIHRSNAEIVCRESNLYGN